MRLATLPLTLIAAALAACGGSPTDNAALSELSPPPGTGDPQVSPDGQRVDPNDQAVLTIVELNIDPTLTEGCGTTPPPSPMFRFDSERLTAEAEARIARIGECLSTGRLASAEVLLVGHADPRGSGEYNEKLAASRAEQVARLLTARGVDRARITIQSEGERAARPDPGHWPLERRVDIAVRLPEGVVDAGDVEGAAAE